MTPGIDAILNRARKVRDDLALPVAARDRVAARQAHRRRSAIRASRPPLPQRSTGSAQRRTIPSRTTAASRATSASWPAGARRIRRRAATSCRRCCAGSPVAPSSSHRERARVVLDWLVSIQLPDGGFQGGVIGQIAGGARHLQHGADPDRPRERRCGARRRVSARNAEGRRLARRDAG